MFRFVLLLMLLSFAVACGGSDKPDSKTSGGGSSAVEEDDEEDTGISVRQTYSADKGTAAVSGTIKFEGKARRRPIDMGSEKYCVNCYSEDGTPPKSESVIVGDNGELANVFVTVTKGLKNWKFKKGSGEVLIDQIKCMYVPHVTAVQVGQTLKVKNSDGVMHNIHATDKNGTDWFNQGQPNKGDVFTREVTDAGIYTMKCDVHGWMSSYICVVKNPFYDVTGTDGAFSLDKLPAGTYTIEAWHEKYGTQTQEVTVGDGETKSISFTFKK